MTSQLRQPIHSIHNKKFWTEFFYLYESLPALWDVNNPLYKSRHVKGDAYDMMVYKLREIEPAADREDVVRKINIFRTNYRRECSRINLSLQEGRQYKSTLWYFDLLMFLQTADTRRERKRRALDDGIEKSIMRKRRTLVNITKHSDTILVATKKGDIIEYQPHSTATAHATEIDYDTYEEPDFDYVVEDLSQSLVDSKSARALQIPTADVYHDLHAADEDDNSQNDDYDHEHDFENYSMHTNVEVDSKNNLTAQNIAITTTIESNANADADRQHLILPDDFSNEATAANDNDGLLKTTIDETTWCSSDTPKNLTLHNSKHSAAMCSSSGINLSTHNIHASSSTPTKLHANEMKQNATKMVRDVKTMTWDDDEAINIHSHCAKFTNTSEIIAKSWAIQYEELSQDQKVLARKAINDILFDGCMGQLTLGSNGRVSNGDSLSNKNSKSSKGSLHDEVESGVVYQQAATTSTNSLPSNVMHSEDDFR